MVLTFEVDGQEIGQDGGDGRDVSEGEEGGT